MSLLSSRVSTRRDSSLNGSSQSIRQVIMRGMRHNKLLFQSLTVTDLVMPDSHVVISRLKNSLVSLFLSTFPTSMMSLLYRKSKTVGLNVIISKLFYNHSLSSIRISNDLSKAP